MARAQAHKRTETRTRRRRRRRRRTHLHTRRTRDDPHGYGHGLRCRTQCIRCRTSPCSSVNLWNAFRGDRMCLPRRARKPPVQGNTYWRSERAYRMHARRKCLPVQWLGVMPRFVSKNLSSRGKRYILTVRTPARPTAGQSKGGVRWGGKGDKSGRARQGPFQGVRGYSVLHARLYISSLSGSSDGGAHATSRLSVWMAGRWKSRCRRSA